MGQGWPVRLGLPGGLPGLPGLPGEPYGLLTGLLFVAPVLRAMLMDLLMILGGESSTSDWSLTAM